MLGRKENIYSHRMCGKLTFATQKKNEEHAFKLI